MLFEREGKVRKNQMVGPHEFLFSKRILFLYGGIDIVRVDFLGSTWLIDALLALDLKSDRPIKLVINSPGGIIEEGLILYDTIKSLRSPLYTIGRSCQSLAAIILASGTQGHRYLYPNSRIMLHLPFGVLSGDSEEVGIQTKELMQAKNKLVEILIDNGVPKTPKAILKDINREFWLSAEEAIKYGLADKIIDSEFWGVLNE